MNAESAALSPSTASADAGPSSQFATPPAQAGPSNVVAPAITPQLPNHFYADADVDALRFGRDAAQIADAIITHLNGLVGAKVNVSLQIEASVPEGISETVQRTVSENCRTLKIHFEFDRR
jgi:hypothetical protein